MTAVLDRLVRVASMPESLNDPADVDLAGAERVARALDNENSGVEAGALVVAGRCLLAGYFEMPGRR